MVRRVFVVVGSLLLVGGLGVGAARVVALESDELERHGEWTRLEEQPGADGTPEAHRELVRAELRAGDDATFEVCARDALDPARWTEGVKLVVWNPVDQELIVQAPMDEALLARARRSERGACIVVARGASLSMGGVYAIEVAWPGVELSPRLRDVPLRARIIAHRPLDPKDPWLVFGVLLGALLLVVGLSRWDLALPAVQPSSPSDAARGRAGPALRVAAGLAAFLSVGLLAAVVPVWGSVAAFGRGLGIAAVEALAAWTLVDTERGRLGRPEVLGLVRPRHRIVMLAGAPVAGLLLWIVGGLALQLVPATGEAPIEALVTWPSGTLAVALVAVIVPVAEELFFRGFVYGTIARRHGELAAFAVTLLLFVLAHVPQAFGAWGALTGIAITGLGLTGLRWATGSTLVPTLAHLVHNGVIVTVSVGAAVVPGG